jgi:hypothetical protein
VSAQLASSPPFSLSGAASPPTNIITPSHCVMLSSHGASQDELAVSASSFSNVSSCRLPSQAKTEALNLHHRHWTSSSDRLTPTFYCYIKIILTLITLLPITQHHLNFASSLARAPRHQNSISYHRSLSLSSHVHRTSTQQHTW